MKKYTTYHLVVIFIYIILLPLAIFFEVSGLNYSFVFTPVSLIALGLIGACFGFFLQVHKRVKILYAIAHGFIFAVPEEIIFRGVILENLTQHFNLTAAILLSSLIYGVAHIFNGAKSFHPRDWNWRLVQLAALAGLPLGWLYVYTDSLLLPTMLHVLFIVFLEIYLPDQIRKREL